MVKLRQVEIDLNDIVVGYVSFDMIPERFKQLGFSAAANTRDDLDIRSPDYMYKFFQILISSNQFYDASPLVQYYTTAVYHIQLFFKNGKQISRTGYFHMSVYFSLTDKLEYTGFMQGRNFAVFSHKRKRFLRLQKNRGIFRAGRI